MAAPPATRASIHPLDRFSPGPPDGEIPGSSSESGRAAARAIRRYIPVVLTIAALTVLLLLPALFNGYPVLFSDTSDYIARSRTLRPSPIRAPGYGVWIHLTGAGRTLWLPVIAQSLMLAALIWRTLRAFGISHALPAVAIVLVLVVGSSVGWASSKAMPDVFVAMLILAIYLVAAHWDGLGVSGRVLSSAAIVISGTMHLTNLIVGAAALGAVLMVQRMSAPRLARARWLLPAAALAASGALVRGYDLARRNSAESVSNSDVFILSHLVETGLAQQLLQERCGSESFALCPVRDSLTRQVELFVWRPTQSPRYLVLHDDPALIRAETRHILSGIVLRHPLALGASVLRYTGEQFVTFQVNEDIWRHVHRMEVQRAIIDVFPGDLFAQERARQQANTLRLGWSPTFHLVVFLAAAAFSLIVILRAASARALDLRNTLGFHVVIWVTLLVNAAVCANLASVFSRYQSRVSWLLPFAVLATLAERGALRWRPGVMTGTVPA